MLTIPLEIDDRPGEPRCPSRSGPMEILACERENGHVVPAQLSSNGWRGDFHAGRDLAGRWWFWPKDGE